MNIEAAEAVLRAVLDKVCGAGRTPPGPDDLPKSASTNAKASNGMEAFLIRQMHHAFAGQYDGPEHRVLSKAHRDEAWKRREFLHDLTVIERIEAVSPYRAVKIPIASRLLWQVESELSGNGRHVAIDFSKLVAGSAEAKLMVVRLPSKRQTKGVESVSNFLAVGAKAVQGHLFIAFFPPYASALAALDAWRQLGALPIRLFRKSGAGVLEDVGWPEPRIVDV